VITLIKCDQAKNTCFFLGVVYDFSMATEEEKDKIRQISAYKDLIFALEGDGLNNLVADFLNQITLDTQWLIDRLSETWKIIESYQDELKEMNGNL